MSEPKPKDSNIEFVRDYLTWCRDMSKKEKHSFLTYLIDMAVIESSIICKNISPDDLKQIKGGQNLSRSAPTTSARESAVRA